MIFPPELPDFHHFPATEALSSVFPGHNEKKNNKWCKHVDDSPGTEASRRIKIFPLSPLSPTTTRAVTGVERPGSFDMSDIAEATQRIQIATEFPMIRWSFEEKNASKPGADGTWSWMHSPSAKRRKCRGVVRSISSCDLFEMLVDDDVD